MYLCVKRDGSCICVRRERSCIHACVLDVNGHVVVC